MYDRFLDQKSRPRRRGCGSAAVGTLVLVTVGCRAPSDVDVSADALAVGAPGLPAPPGPRRTGVVRTSAPGARDIPLSAEAWQLSAPGAGGTGEHAAMGGAPLVAEVSVDDDDGDFPRRVAFDATDSALGTGQVTYEWSFGDGSVTHEGPTTLHAYIGAGEFVATLTLTDATGRQSVDEVTIDMSAPDCPEDEPPLTLGDLEDDDLDGISGVAASRMEPGAYWVHQDVDVEAIVAVDLHGETLSEHELATPLLDVEDIAAVVDPATGLPMLFIGDVGDNDLSRDEVAIWIVEEPDPLDDGDIDPFQVRLAYPYGPVNAETLIVDPFTLDLFLITKRVEDAETEVFVKRAPHEEGGPFVVEALGEFESLDFTATAGDVSLDGLRVVVRGYGDTAYVWMRDGFRPLEEVFAEDPCEVDISEEDQGEAVTFSIDGRGLVTTSEGEGEAVWFIGI